MVIGSGKDTSTTYVRIVKRLVDLVTQSKNDQVQLKPIPVAAWSKALARGQSFAGTVCSNPAGGMGVSRL